MTETTDMQFNNLKISTRLTMGFGALVGMVALVALVGMGIARSTNQSINTIYNNHLVPITQLKMVQGAYMSSVLDSSNKVSLGLLDPAKAMGQVKDGVARAAEQWKAYTDTAVAPEEKKSIEEINALINKSQGPIKEFSLALENGDMYKISLLIKDLDENIVPIGRAINTLIDYQLEAVKTEHANSNNSYSNSLSIFSIIIVVAVIVAVYVTVAVTAFSWLLFVVCAPPHAVAVGVVITKAAVRGG
ncbi:MAG: MCP four helix bundle domain-containing protein, partial [Rhodoferax sp.]